MIQAKYNTRPFLMEDEEEEAPKEEKQEQIGSATMKKMEKLFFEKRAIYLWGVVDDKSAKDIVTKFCY